MGYFNPLLKLPAMQELMDRPAADRELFARLLTEMRLHANAEAEKSWKRRKGPMAFYWRVVATYCRHIAHALTRGAATRHAASVAHAQRHQAINRVRNGAGEQVPLC